MTDNAYDPYKKFVEKYPDLFFDGTCLCGISIGEGWDTIVNSALHRIYLWSLANPEANKEFSITVDQIKEKFGGLRIYTNFACEEVDEIIKVAEKEALETCEFCGSKEDVTTEGRWWIKTLCKECHSKKEQ